MLPLFGWSISVLLSIVILMSNLRKLVKFCWFVFFLFFWYCGPAELVFIIEQHISSLGRRGSRFCHPVHSSLMHFLKDCDTNDFQFLQMANSFPTITLTLSRFLCQPTNTSFVKKFQTGCRQMCVGAQDEFLTFVLTGIHVLLTLSIQ